MPRIDWLITGLRVTGGAEMYVRRVAPLLRQSGWDLRVVTFVSGGQLVDDLRAEGVPVIELGLRHNADLSVLTRLGRLWRSDPPDLLHTHLYHAGLIGRIVGHRTGIAAIVVHQHGAELARSPLRSLLDRATTTWVTRYVSSCHAVARILTTREHIRLSRIEVIYNGLDSTPFSVHPSHLTLPQGWPVPTGAKVVGSVGRLSPEKGQKWLLEALARLIHQGQDLHAVLVGEGRSLLDLQNQARRLRIAERVHFPRARRDIWDWLANFDLFVLPSEWEGVSLALLEAMASGLPVIATNTGGTPEIVLDGETGLLVPARDPGKLAEVMQRLLGDPFLRDQIGQSGRAHALENFTIQNTVTRLNQLYHGLLRSSSNTPPLDPPSSMT
jgi:glycosyltransferase involved in cell wall biosynthesis